MSLLSLFIDDVIVEFFIIADEFDVVVMVVAVVADVDGTGVERSSAPATAAAAVAIDDDDEVEVEWWWWWFGTTCCCCCSAVLIMGNFWPQTIHFVRPKQHSRQNVWPHNEVTGNLRTSSHTGQHNGSMTALSLSEMVVVVVDKWLLEALVLLFTINSIIELAKHLSFSTGIISHNW